MLVVSAFQKILLLHTTNEFTITKINKSIEINEQHLCNSDSSLGTNDDNSAVCNIRFGSSNNNIDISYFTRKI